MKYFLVMGLTLITLACNRPNQPEGDKPKQVNAKLETFYAVYGLEPGLPDVAELKNALGGNIYSQIKEDLDFEKVQLLTSTITNELIFIVPLKQVNKFYAVKAIKAESLIVQEELLFSSSMKNKDNGTIGILKNDSDALLIEIENGHIKYKGLTEKDFRAHFMKSNWTAGFCQRETGQTFSDCFKHEVDEFCDSFISCIAVSTQPQVSIVIAIACSCNAS